MRRLNQLVTRVCYYPSLGFSAGMFAVGAWRKWDWLDESVLLGAVPTRRDIDRLADLGITAIVNLCEEFRGHTRLMSERGIEQLQLPTLDFHCPAVADIQRGVDFLMERARAERRSYVHCKVGRARSATLCLCYLIASYGLSPEQGFARLRTARPQVTRGLERRPLVLEWMRQQRSHAGDSRGVATIAGSA